MSERWPDMSRIDAGSVPNVVVIGGGATGCGVARDLCLRGFAVTLVEFDDLGSGSSARFHGMLQSGARYAVSDPEYAAECMRERNAIASIAPEAVEATGGLFVSLPDDPPDFADRFAAGCRRSRIPCEELDPARVMAQESAISRSVQRAFSVPDATVHSWRLVNLIANDIVKHGGRILTRHQVRAIRVQEGRVRGVSVFGEGRACDLEADAVVNAAGPWSARVAALAGQSVALELTKGSIIVLAHRLVGRAVNRCRPPTSHDIIVPTGTVSLFGTTSEVVDDPDTTRVNPSEIQALLDGAEPLIPGIHQCRALRAWAGVRPLVKPKDWSADEPLPRRHHVIDHAEFGVDGFFTVCGGSLTTHRSMAEDVANRVCARYDINRRCETASISLGRMGASAWRPAAGYERTEREHAFADVICECEAVSRAEIEALVRGAELDDLHDLRRRLRVGFGPCQGTFCGPRVAELLTQMNPRYSAEGALRSFWTERLKGAVRTAWAEQARQILLSDLVCRELLGLRLDPGGLPREER